MTFHRVSCHNGRRLSFDLAGTALSADKVPGQRGRPFFLPRGVRSRSRSSPAILRNV